MDAPFANGDVFVKSFSMQMHLSMHKASHPETHCHGCDRHSRCLFRAWCQSLTLCRQDKQQENLCQLARSKRAQVQMSAKHR